MNSRPDFLAQLARAVADTEAEGTLALRLCRAYVEILDANGGAITLAYTEPERVR
ncbi:MAG: hypothetical protein ACRD3Q_11790 [Terriglobales bacterium]